ncbi:MAG TPA: sialidase family protein, partial [Chthoniobacterales bacterium]|nr:sialidase family protein [Chthoniobacterales bacterium]
MKKNSVSRSGLSHGRILIACALVSVSAFIGYLAFGTIIAPNGTLTEVSGPITFTGGPYLVANPSSQASGVPTCNAVLVCDEFALTVSGLSAATTASKYIRIEVRWPEAGETQFDLYVFQGSSANGQLIARNLGNATYVDPDAVLIPAVDGSYTIRVVPFLPNGQSITGTVSLVPFPPVAPVDPGVAPTFTNNLSPSGLGNSAGEPSIGVDWAPRDPSLKHDKVNTGGVAFFTSNTQQLRVSFNDATNPPIALWENMNAPVQTGLDPIGFVDHETGRVFGMQLAAGSSNAAFSDDDGTSWTNFVAGGPPAGPDHETLGGGPYNETAFPPPPPHPLYKNATYYCSQNIAGGAECSRSDNGGATFGPGIDIFDPTECYGGIHGHVKVGPDGTVYVPNSSCSAGTGSQGVAISRDNGLTWVDKTVPKSVGSGDPSVGVGADNTVYLGYVNGDGRPHIAVSTDHGQTWINDLEVGVPVGCAPGDQYAPCRIKSAVFPTVVAGDGDRAAFGFLGSTTGGNFENEATYTGIWNFYVATTYDRGAHWVTVNATPGDPVQKGSICLLGVLCGNDRNLLDFNDIAVDREGRSIAAYADGCVPALGCVSPDFKGRANKAAIIRQATGRRLFAAFDPITPAPTPTPSNVQLLNISGRVLAQGGDKVGIGGFVITGTSAKTVIVRAIGPSMTVNGAPVPGRLDDPKLELRANDGHLIAANDSWRSTQEQQIQQSGLAPTDNREAAIIASLPAGQYTAIISGANNSSGIGLVEIYDLESTLPGELGNL